MVLGTQWSQVEIIDLFDDGSGLGFGLVGGRSTGVAIKWVLPGGIAGKDGRLRSGDHVIRIGDVSSKGLGADQVASVLRQTGPQVQIVVARPIVNPEDVENNSCYCGIIVPTKILSETDELERRLEALTRNDGFVNVNNNNNDSNSTNVSIEEEYDDSPISTSDIILNFDETLRYTASLKIRKDGVGLGLTVAGYVCACASLNGVFVKEIAEGSEASKLGTIQVNDRIIKVDDQLLIDLDNREAVQVLKNAIAADADQAESNGVCLTFERYLSGPKSDWLVQQTYEIHTKEEPPPPYAIINSEIEENIQELIPTPSITSPPPIESTAATQSITSLLTKDEKQYSVADKWRSILGRQSGKIIVANLTKLEGLGISLEGTVDVEGIGVESHARHFIRSIHPDGPAGKDKSLRPGDELLEANGIELRGTSHVNVVQLLKGLPPKESVRLVCLRESEIENMTETNDDRMASPPQQQEKDRDHEPIQETEEILYEAKILDEVEILNEEKIRDELEILDEEKIPIEQQISDGESKQYWNRNKIEYIDLMIDKENAGKGLGFSILDYLDPDNIARRIIVINSISMNGLAHIDGRLSAGDRLVSVNDTIVENCTLDHAVRALKGAIPGTVRLGILKSSKSTC